MPLPLALTFSIMANHPPITHGCFNRHGGTSTGLYSSLNCGQNCGDNPKQVASNRQIIAKHLGCDKIITLRQIHGNKIVIIDKSSACDQQADAMICASPGLGLLIQQADCQAVLLYDPNENIVANIHVGWRGNVQNIITKTIQTMIDHFACRPDTMLAAISPSLGPCCAEFRHYQQEFPAHFSSFQVKANYFDLWELSRQQLRQAGIAATNIQAAEICTCCNQDYFSYRRHQQTGRCASVIGLRHG